MKRNVLVFTLVMAVCVLSHSALFAQDDVNIRTKSLIERAGRVITPRFLDGLTLIMKNRVVGKGKGIFGGDASLNATFFPGSKGEYMELMKSGNITQSDKTKIWINVEVYDTPQQAKASITAADIAKGQLQEGSFTGAPMGDKVWSGMIEKTPAPEENAEDKEEEEKEDKAKEETIEKTSDRYEINLVVVKKFYQFRVTGINYQAIPETEQIENIMNKMLEKI